MLAMSLTLNAYTLIIFFAFIVILSYIYNVIAHKTNIPAVILLIFTGIGLQYAMGYFGVGEVDFFSVLEILGIVGLIMIVLEAALDLELKKEKIPLIIKSFLSAIIGLGLTVGAIAMIFNYLLHMPMMQSILYATPLSIMSSAIIIPSIDGLKEHKKEFMVFESTFSDIAGIMLFYFIVSMMESGEIGTAATEFGISLALTLVVSLVASFLLIVYFQKITAHVKMFLMISILLMLYAVGKLFHLSPLLIILIFGLVLKNHRSVFVGGLKRFVNPFKLDSITKSFYVVTIETAFLVRTFFFVVFGLTITLTDLLDVEVIYVSVLAVIIMYIVRFLVLIIFNGRDFTPQLFLAPRGLITILLFFAIPESLAAEGFKSGILLFVILVSCFIMMFALIANKMQLGDKLSGEEDPATYNQDLFQQGSEHPPATVDSGGH